MAHGSTAGAYTTWRFSTLPLQQCRKARESRSTRAFVQRAFVPSMGRDKPTCLYYQEQKLMGSIIYMLRPASPLKISPCVCSCNVSPELVISSLVRELTTWGSPFISYFPLPKLLLIICRKHNIPYIHPRVKRRYCGFPIPVYSSRQFTIE